MHCRRKKTRKSDPHTKRVLDRFLRIHHKNEQIEEEDNVYDVLDEEEYEHLVRDRRQREDFVVDDGASPVCPPSSTCTCCHVVVLHRIDVLTLFIVHRIKRVWATTMTAKSMLTSMKKSNNSVTWLRKV